MVKNDILCVFICLLLCLGFTVYFFVPKCQYMGTRKYKFGLILLQADLEGPF